MKLLFWPFAGLIHGAVVTVLICGSYWHVDALPGPKPVGAFMVQKGVPAAKIVKAESTIGTPPPRTLPVVPQIVPLADNGTPQDNSAAPVSFEGPALGESPNGGGEGIGPSGIGNGPIDSVGIGGEPVNEQPVIISPDMQTPILIHKVEPPYPPLALRAHIQGVVQLEAIISKTGTVEGIRMISSPHPILTNAAVQAVQQWKYRPATLNGKPLSVYFTVTVKFGLT